MEDLECISIRGRMAYLICLFEKLLLYYNCKKEEWKCVLEKLWTYTSIQYLDEWMYVLAEYMPNSILEDTIDGAEYITESEFKHLYKLYNESNQEICSFLEIIYECGTCELYSRLCDCSPSTLEKVGQAIDIMKIHNIDLIDTIAFKIYSYSERNGWGSCFEGKYLSKFI